MTTSMSWDLGGLVNEAADDFEKRFGVTVSPGARRELIKAGEPHIAAIQTDLDTGKVSLGFLKEVLFEVLQNAQTVAVELGRTEIGEDTTVAAMDRKCRYLGWC